MMQPLLWLLLPVAAASSWWLAKRDTRHRSGSSGSAFCRDYFQGLNYLLAEQSDKAIEIFVRMLEVSSETVEIHFLLASLFRRRGEVDRAIRIHQNLIARPTLTDDQRTQAMLELGQDYMRAGLFDRAEALFKELLESTPHEAAALRLLADIYQQEKEWNQAIVVTRRLASATGERQDGLIAQFHCELAALAAQHGDYDQAKGELKQALSHDPACARASLLLGEMLCAAGDYAGAVQALKRVEQQDASRIPEIVQPMVRCYRALDGTVQLRAYLEDLLARHGGVGLALALMELVREMDGDAAAVRFLTERLHAHPSFRGLVHLIDLSTQEGSVDARQTLIRCRDTLGRYLDDCPGYRCQACGFSGKTLHWHCPGCKKWNTVKPIIGIEGE